MSSGASVVHAGVPPSPVKAKSAKPKKRVAIKKPKTGSKKLSPSHPPTSAMVNAAITNLKERGGSSTQAIKKYVSSTYKIDGEKAGPLIRKYLKAAADKGLLTRTKGKGASGSFKIQSTSTVKPVAAEASSASPRKPIAVIKLKKPKAPRKTKVAKPKRAKPAKKAPSKAKKSAKKPKTSKPKTKKVVKKRAAKK